MKKYKVLLKPKLLNSKTSLSEMDNSVSTPHKIESLAYDSNHPNDLETNNLNKEKEDSWVERFKQVCISDQNFATYWFWDNFNWNKQSMWIGKFNKINHLPSSDEQILCFIKKIIDDLNRYSDLKQNIYLKIYFSRDVTSNQPEINYLLICNYRQLPPNFENTLLNVIFERYQITDIIAQKDPNIKKLIEHYIIWNNYFPYCDLINQVQF